VEASLGKIGIGKAEERRRKGRSGEETEEREDDGS